MRYSRSTAARLGGHVLTFTPPELGRLLSATSPHRVIVKQTFGRGRGDGQLLVKTRSREVVRISLTRCGELKAVGLTPAPWTMVDARLLSTATFKFRMLLKNAKRGVEAGLAWREVVRNDVKMLEARRPGVFIGTIEPVDGSFALFIDGEKIGRNARNVLILKRRAETWRKRT